MGDLAVRRAALGVVLITGALFASATPARAQHHVDRTAQLDRDGEFRIWNMIGSVRVTGWDVDSVRVVAYLDERAYRRFGFGADGAAGKIGIDSDGRTGRADLLVYVPRGATVWVKTLSAPVVITALAGSIDVYSVSGDVHIETAARSVYAESMGGDIRVVGSSPTVRLRSGSGALDFTGSTLDLSLASVGGAVTVRAAGLRRAVVETVGGDVRMDARLEGDASVEVLTHDGDVELALPAASSARAALRSVTGSVRNARGPGAEPGRGAASIEVRTFSGGILLRDSP
ncbi:MAG TPA: DUF4097 family beta strand repeat-containing protein [Longimicrobiales bacterium]|nr:DUF4097 family beta strand repeat-containing protein [Longimicrobiales bacterium]